MAVSLQDEFARDLTASRPDADVQWKASNDFAAAFRISPDRVWTPANTDDQPEVHSAAAKRALDLIIAVPMLILIAPLLALIAALILIDSGGTVFFRQTRLGLHGKPFDIFKFRTMRVMENGATVEQAKANDDRVTRIGRFLRKTSIDELPQLLNVITGEMSLVGPRPHARDHDLFNMPGITGWAQVNGHRCVTPTFADMLSRVDYDFLYTKHLNFMLDLKFLAVTP